MSIVVTTVDRSAQALSVESAKLGVATVHEAQGWHHFSKPKTEVALLPSGYFTIRYRSNQSSIAPM